MLCRQLGGCTALHVLKVILKLQQGCTVMMCSRGIAMTAGSHQALQPLEALLAVVSHPDNDLAAMSFNFWHRLSRHLTSSFGPSGGAAGGAGASDTAVGLPSFPLGLQHTSGRSHAACRTKLFTFEQHCSIETRGPSMMQVLFGILLRCMALHPLQ